MRAVEPKRSGLLARLASLVVIAAGVAVLALLLKDRADLPASDDAGIDAEVVHVAPAVGGRILSFKVAENARVARGEVLFDIDPAPYRLAVDQARADLAIAEALLETQRRAVGNQRSAAAIAAEQVRRAGTNLDLANRTVDRLTPLAARGYVPAQQLDQAQTAARDAATSLRQAREQEAAAARAIDTDAAGDATVAARKAALALAERALENTVVRAPHDGLVVGLSVAAGEMVVPAQALFTLINREEWFAIANFREYELGRIAIGDCATVYSMIDRTRPIQAKVTGIGWGVFDQDRITLPRAMPIVERSLNWVRVAQRFPVRLRLEAPPAELMRVGASATVEIRHGRSCS